MTENDLNSFENLQVLFMVQALAGNLTAAMRAVTIKCSQRAVFLTFVLCQDEPKSREDIEDIVFEFEALQTRNIDIHVNVKIDNNYIRECVGSVDGRAVVLRKD